MVFFGYNSKNPLSGILSYIYYKKSKNFFEIEASMGSDSSSPDFLLQRDKDICGLWYGSQNWSIKLQKKLLLTNYELENSGCEAIGRTHPIDFNILGSNDGKTWKNIDKRTDQKFCETVDCYNPIVFEYSIEHPEPFY